MLKNLLLLLAAMFLITFATAQEIEWQNTIGGSGADVVHSVIQTTDGGYILGGSSNSNISGDKTENSNGSSDYWLVKIDSIGNIQWQNTIGGNGFDEIFAVIQTIDGGYLLAGSSDSNISGDKTENSNGGSDYWIVKTDPTGNIQWQNSIGGNADESLYSVVQTTDEGYLLGGYSSSNISGDKTENCGGLTDYWIVKTDSNGNIIWENTIGGADQDEMSSVILTNDGGFLLGGNSQSNISGDKSEDSNGADDYWIVKTDSLGNILWQNTIGGSQEDYFFNLVKSNDGGYLIGGFSNSNISGDKMENSNGFEDFWIVKTDSMGIIKWQNTIGGSESDYFNYVVAAANGEYLIGSDSYSSISGDKTENSNLNNDLDLWVVNTDSAGNIKWQNTIRGDDNEIFGACTPTADGGYLLGGSSQSNISGDKTENSMGGSDFWIVKITGNYNLITGKTFADLNSDLVRNPTEPSMINTKVTESFKGRFSFSDSSGFYRIPVFNTGNFEVIPDYINFYNPVPLVHTGNFTAIHQIDSLNDFAFQPTGIYNDLCLSITPTSPFRSGFNANYRINYTNQGTTTFTPTIVFYPDNDVNFVSASIPPTTITPDSVVFVVGSLTPFQSGQISITVSVDAGLPIGTLINSGAMILPIANDANPGCNSSYWEVFTTGSVDPNDILVNRSFLYDYEMPSPPDLEYIINFQNTGNDTAFTVKILNPIDTNKLDLSTLEITATSHPADVRFVYHERNLEFVMNNILLPDSNVNEMESHGFVRYKIKPKTTVAVGDSIQNFAAIYFDYNNPVITNTAVTQIVSPTGLNPPTAHGLRPTISPNPFMNEFTVQLSDAVNQKLTIELYNIYGQKVRDLYSDKINYGNWSRKFDMSDLSQGVYFIRVNNRAGTTTKIIKL